MKKKFALALALLSLTFSCQGPLSHEEEIHSKEHHSCPCTKAGKTCECKNCDGTCSHEHEKK